MEDKRNLTMGIRVSAADTIGQLTKIMESIDNIKSGFQKAEDNADKFGSEAAESAGTLAHGMQDARQETSKVVTSMDKLSDSGDKVEDSAKDARRAFENMGNTASKSATEARKNLDNASAAADEFRKEINKTSDAGEDASNTYRNMGAEAQGFGSAAASSAAKALKETNSLGKAVKAGFQGAYGYAGKQAEQFTKKARDGLNELETALRNPIQTIKNRLVDALEKAGKKIKNTGDEADKTGDDLKNMGSDGESAGTRIKDAVGGAVKSFFAISVAIEIVKAGIEAAKQLGSAIMEAGIASEQTGAKFGAMFSADTGVQEWADNFSDAIHRSNTEVQGFLVKNKAMYQEMGITGTAADDLSKITTSLAYDFGAAFSMDDAEALATVQDYLKGNTEAMAEFGLQIDDTALKQSAMKMGLGKNIDALDEAAMAQVRMNALLQNSTEIQQAATKKQEGYANNIKNLKGIWSEFLSGAASKFAPVFTELTNTIMASWPQIEPALMGLVDMLSNGMAEGMPVIMDLATNALPPLIQTMGELFAAAEPIGGAILELATTALPPLVEAVTPVIQTFGELAEAILPPLSRIISNIAKTVVPPLAEIFQSLSENVIIPLIPHIESIANAILPALAAGLEAVSPLLDIISPVLSGIAGILSDVVGFLGKIVEWAAGGLGNLLDKVAGVFGGGSKAAASAGVNIPHNADGDNYFQGGWTHINERGGEIAYLPSGSTIVPADKSEQIIAGGRQQSIKNDVNFNPTIRIEILGGSNEGTPGMMEDLKQTVKELYQEMQEEHFANLAIQQGNA